MVGMPAIARHFNPSRSSLHHSAPALQPSPSQHPLPPTSTHPPPSPPRARLGTRIRPQHMRAKCTTSRNARLTSNLIFLDALPSEAEGVALGGAFRFRLESITAQLGVQGERRAMGGD